MKAQAVALQVGPNFATSIAELFESTRSASRLEIFTLSKMMM